jgi:DNA-binding NarL/FixJ family response regulator
MTTVLIADDSRPLRERLIALCGEVDGIRVVGQAGDCREALARADALRPDVVVLDVRMPDGSGIDVLSQVKRARPAPVVIMLTGHALPQYRTRCLAAGADFFFDKSSELEQVAEALGRLARGREAGPAGGGEP